MSEKFKFPDTGQELCFSEEGKLIKCPQPGEKYFGQDGCFTGD